MDRQGLLLRPVFLVINAIILWFSSKFVPGFSVTAWKGAFSGALALAILHLLFGFIKGKAKADPAPSL